MSGTTYKFEGWLAHDASAAEGKMTWGEFEPKPWEETDIDIKVTHCGICGSDLHTLRSGWGPTIYPCCVGHEIVGIAVRVGSQAVGEIKVGDRVGVGAQSDSCQNRTGTKCAACAAGMENYCQVKHVGTYNGRYMNGGKSYGGYATYNRAPSRFVVKIPDAIASAEAAPMLCGGITTYTPLKHYGAGPGKAVGIIGLGGLGHFGVMWASALGADKVVVVSRSRGKAADAAKMGATDFIATGEDEGWAKKHAATLDIIICTVSSADMPLQEYMSLLRFDGTFVQVGAPEDGLPGFLPWDILYRRLKLTGSMIGSPNGIREMLQLAAEKNVKPWVTEVPMKDANKAILEMEAGVPRYRYTLVNEEQPTRAGL
ncbi:chaperonin 10-like protein [Lasiosphaeria miniovina]|uniref:alcohol dehydrogenase (NADP(+)) n=1 Tax=Lasiosphaeria miniovina TaxID=1954250 RepID=A0AA40DM34_9PEZI|nr:chaperonin 10-like protein [Lasiosphaeria miniovina]KAK0706266.1 chaperonin 10-like protein [Lasiosphaeria miniovina]